MFDDKERQRKCYENAIALVKILLNYYGWGVDKVKRHKDWSGKHCPAWLIEGKFGYTWDWYTLITYGRKQILYKYILSYPLLSRNKLLFS